MSRFKKAVRKALKLRLALCGPAGSGKSFTALRIAMGLVPGGRIGVVDTEGKSASLYVGVSVPEGVIHFEVDELDSFEPQRFISAVNDAVAEGLDVLIIDSLSHAWEGILAELDKVQSKQRTANSFTAWKDVTPMHNELVATILQAPIHIICTMRTKTEYVLEEGRNGKTQPKKVGTAPIQRAGMEYEFGVVADMTIDNQMIITKTRCQELNDRVFTRAGGDVAAILREWLDGGETPSEYLDRALTAAGITSADFDAWSAGLKTPRPGIESMTDGQKHAAASYLEGDGARVVRAVLEAQKPKPLSEQLTEGGVA